MASAEHVLDHVSPAALGTAALEYVAAGWPVIPTRGPEHTRLVCRYGSPDAATARQWWSDPRYGIGCLTGAAFDIVQVPAWLGARMVSILDRPGPVIRLDRAGESVWQFLVTANSRPIRDIPRACQARLIGHGGWIVLPPTQTSDGGAAWAASGPDCPLPHSLHVQWAVIRAWNTQAQPALDDDALAELRRRYEAGATLNALAAELGRSRKAVRRMLLHSGVRLRQHYPNYGRPRPSADSQAAVS